MSGAGCTPGREPRSVAASYNETLQQAFRPLLSKLSKRRQI